MLLGAGMHALEAAGRQSRSSQGKSTKYAKQTTIGQQLAKRETRIAREANAKRIATGLAITPMDLEPEVSIMNTAFLADSIHLGISTYARGLKPEEIDLLTLWCLSTWAADPDGNLLFDAHGRVALIAPKGSGKSIIERIMQAFVRNPTGIATMATAPGVRDALTEHMTVFLDEYDRMIGKNGLRRQDLQALVNTYQAKGGSLNGIGKLNQEEAYSPLVFAAKPRMLITASEWVEDTLERCWVITPRKHTDQDDVIPDMGGEFNMLAELIKEMAQNVGKFWWSQENGESLRPIHSVPKELIGRQREIASPILAVADRCVDPEVFAKNGSDLRWAIRARKAVETVLFGYSADDGAQQVARIRDAFTEMGINIEEA